MTKVLLSGNEAIARGAYEAGVRLASSYPGTPATEILENIAQYSEIKTGWAPNEKVAYDVAMGAAMAGIRALVSFKHVGLNVASDSFMTSAYTGINAGLVIVSADDPGMFSSQNEQDNRNYARFAKIPMLEPSDSQEAKDFVIYAFDLSERFDIPVLVRISTRICHSKSVVELGKRVDLLRRPYRKDMEKYTMLPTSARKRRVSLEERFDSLMKFSEEFEGNRIIEGSDELGIVTSGITYQYVREALPHASILKVGMGNPLPMEKIRGFRARIKKLIVVEELDPFMEEEIRAHGIRVDGGKSIFQKGGEAKGEGPGFKVKIPNISELSVEIIREAITGERVIKHEGYRIPERPPVLCPGCLHRGVFYVLKKMKARILGDIGCYTLAAYEPLSAMDSCIAMGASIGNAAGFSRAISDGDGKIKERVVGIIGDSTFIHAGIPALIDCVYNGGDITICILDNRVTAMTGHQVHPATGKTIKGEQTHPLSIEEICKACGVNFLRIVDPFNMKEIRETFREAFKTRGTSVVIVRGHCVIYERDKIRRPLRVEPELCDGCGVCWTIGCPAIERVDDGTSKGKAFINTILCVGCDLCIDLCNRNALVPDQDATV